MTSSPRFPNWYEPQPNEEPRVVTHPHPIVYWKGILTGLIMIAGAVAMFFELEWQPYLEQKQMLYIVGGLVASGAGFIGFEYIKFRTTFYLITTHYIKHRHSVFDKWVRKDDPIHFQKVADPDHLKPLWLYPFDVGHIRIHSDAGTEEKRPETPVYATVR